MIADQQAPTFAREQAAGASEDGPDQIGRNPVQRQTIQARGRELAEGSDDDGNQRRAVLEQADEGRQILAAAKGGAVPERSLDGPKVLEGDPL